MIIMMIKELRGFGEDVIAITSDKTAAGARRAIHTAARNFSNLITTSI